MLGSAVSGGGSSSRQPSEALAAPRAESHGGLRTVTQKALTTHPRGGGGAPPVKHEGVRLSGDFLWHYGKRRRGLSIPRNGR